MAKSRLDATAQEVVATLRSTLLAELGLQERQIDDVLRDVAKGIKTQLRSTGNLGTADVTRIVAQGVNRHAVDLSQRVNGLIQVGIQTGTKAGRRSVSIVNPHEPTPEQVDRAAMQRTGTLLRQRASVRSFPLSSRIRANAERVGQQMRSQLEASIRAGESTERTAERLLQLSPGSAQVPRYVRELQDAARDARVSGDVTHYERAVSRYRSQLNQLGQQGGDDGAYSMRSASRQLARDLQTAKLESIDQIVDRWVLEKARWQARRIARTETVEAFRAGFRERVREKPGVVGIRWTLAEHHPHEDVCNVYAGQDLFRLGPGGYPHDQVPANPHPFCGCQQSAILDSDWQERRLAEHRDRQQQRLRVLSLLAA